MAQEVKIVEFPHTGTSTSKNQEVLQVLLDAGWVLHTITNTWALLHRDKKEVVQ